METILDKQDEELTTAPWTATYLCSRHDFAGNAAEYKMDPPHCGYDIVVVSAIDHDWAYETYIFGLKNSGEEPDWEHLPGSVKGTTSHIQALTSIGYIVK